MYVRDLGSYGLPHNRRRPGIITNRQNLVPWFHWGITDQVGPQQRASRYHHRLRVVMAVRGWHRRSRASLPRLRSVPRERGACAAPGQRHGGTSAAQVGQGLWGPSPPAALHRGPTAPGEVPVAFPPGCYAAGLWRSHGSAQRCAGRSEVKRPPFLLLSVPCSSTEQRRNTDPNGLVFAAIM